MTSPHDSQSAHRAIAKAIEDARSERLAAERRHKAHPLWAPAILGIGCGALGYAFTQSLVVAAVWLAFAFGGVIGTRALRRLPPHDDPPMHRG